MSMKKNIAKDINEIRRITAKFPKTLNEALHFNDLEEDNDDFGGDESIDRMDSIDNKPAVAHEEPQANSSEKARKLIDDIRKMSLKAMAELADTPEDPNYINLKAIWRLCDKAVTEKQEEREVLSKNDKSF